MTNAELGHPPVRAGPDVLVQIHIPKCAGTSVAHWLRDAAVTGVISGFRALYPDYVYADDELQAVGFDDARLTAASTHNIRRFVPTSGGRRLHYFTLLREPRAHFLSAVRHMLLDRQAFGVPESYRTSREVVTWLMDMPPNANLPFRENTQTNHLALYVWCDATAGRCRPECYGSWAPADVAAYLRERLDIAKDTLRSFLAFGTVERLSETLELVRRRSAAFGLQLPPVDRVPRVNVTLVPDDDISWIDAEPLCRSVLESVAVDRQLYEWAQTLPGT